MIDTRRNLLANAWLQLGLVVIIAILANTWMSHRFLRMDLTGEGIYSLDLVTRSLVHRLDKPLVAKVYFTKGLQAPYHNHEQAVRDILEELSAYSKGLLEITVVDPTGDKDLTAEARRFGVMPIDYRYKSESLSELRKVYMGLALVYGDRQEVLPAISQTTTLEYDLARALRALLTDESRKKVGYTTGHGEPDLGKGGGPLERLRTGIAQNADLVPVYLGGTGSIPEEIDALLVVGPQQQLDERSQYQLDQFLMRGGGLAVFLTNTRGDLRSGKATAVQHGMSDLLRYYGVDVKRDLVIDRKRNGVMRFPVRQGRYVLQMPVNYPLLPRIANVANDSAIVGPIQSMLFPFASTIALMEPLPDEVHASVLATSNPSSSRVSQIQNVLPRALKEELPNETPGEWPMLVALNGTWSSFYAGKAVPEPSRPGRQATGGEIAQHLTESANTRLVVAGSADFVANNVPFMLNLVDWLLQDQALVRIRSKTSAPAVMGSIDSDKVMVLKAVNLLGGTVLLLIFGVVRRTWRPQPAAPELAAQPVLPVANRSHRWQKAAAELSEIGGDLVRPSPEPAPTPTEVAPPPPSIPAASERAPRMGWSLADEIPVDPGHEEMSDAQRAKSRRRAQRAIAAMAEAKALASRIEAGESLRDGEPADDPVPPPPSVPDANDADTTETAKEIAERKRRTQISVLTQMAVKPPGEEEE
jgi:gliding-associated putative ABC transporter substrate-binding component GldG